MRARELKRARSVSTLTDRLWSVEKKTCPSQCPFQYTAVSRKVVQQTRTRQYQKVLIMGNGGSWSLIEALGVSAT